MAEPLVPKPGETPEQFAARVTASVNAAKAPSTTPTAPAAAPNVPTGTSGAIPPKGGTAASTGPKVYSPLEGQLTTAQLQQAGARFDPSNQWAVKMLAGGISEFWKLSDFGHWGKVGSNADRAVANAALGPSPGGPGAAPPSAAIAQQQTQQAQAPGGMTQGPRNTSTSYVDPLTSRTMSQNAPGTLGTVRSGAFNTLPQIPFENPTLRRVGINPNEAAFKAQAPEFLRNMSYDISTNYNPENPWSPGANVEQGLSFDYNGPEGAGGESFLYSHPGGTAELRSPEGDWGVGFNATGQAGYGNIGSPASSILQSNGYNPSGDPIADAALAGRIVAMQNAGASTEEYRPEANPTSPSDTLMNPWGAPEQAGADLAYSSFTLGNNELQLAATGYDEVTDDPTLHTNLQTGNTVLSSEYGQPERTTITPINPEDPPGLPTYGPNQPGIMPYQGGQTGAYGDAPTQGFLGEAPRQTEYADYQPGVYGSDPNLPAFPGGDAGPNTPYKPYETNYDSRGRVIYTPTTDRQTYAWQQSPYNPANNYPAGNRYPEPRSTAPAPAPAPANPPIFGGPVPEVPGPGPGGGGGGGGTWPPIPNPPPTPATDFQTDFARRQRQRDIEAQYYPQFGLPRPRGVEVNDPTGLNAPPGLYYESPDYGSALQGMQQQLSLLGNVGNSQALQAQIQQLYSGLTGGPTDAGARTQIAQLQQQLSKAQQAEEIQRQMGVLQSQTNYLGAPMGGAYGDMAGGGMANPMAPTDANALAPATMAAPDISNEDFRWMSRPYPMELARLLQLDNAITQYGDANPEAIRQAEEMVSGIQDPNGQQRATMLLQRVIARLNNGRAPSPGLNMSVLPDDPWAALAVAKYGSAA